MENDKTVNDATNEKKEALQPKADAPVYGTVVNCKNLNVRKRPNQKSEPVLIIGAESKVKVDKSKSTAEFYKVCTASGAEGYCMKQYVQIQ